ncbi:MAG: ATP-binding protein [Treponema sp.]|jgi:anti-sigma regulatory factor (Ser/Thr protein kinase)|nr:ATP-binding protein [Treponema sp.]
MKFHYAISGDDYSQAGLASTDIKKKLKEKGVLPQFIRKAVVSMYEAEINMIIHAGGGTADVELEDDKIRIVMTDTGPGIPDVEKAMREGFSTAPVFIQEIGFGAGMGLANIKRNCDELEINTVPGKGTIIIMTIYFYDQSQNECP